MLATYGSATDQTVLNEVYNELAQLIINAPVSDEYIDTLRTVLATAETADHTEQIEAFIALCMDYRYLLGNLH